MKNEAIGRELEAEERSVLRKLLSLDFPGAKELSGQVDQTKVVGHWGPRSPSIYLDVAANAASAPVADGPTPVRAIVTADSDEPVGELIVWVKSGRLSALEYAWFTDEMPERLPSPERITVELEA